MVNFRNDFLKIAWLIWTCGMMDCVPITVQKERSVNDRMRMTPDISQRDPEGRYANEGNSYCGPSAAANVLLWFGANGFERLVPNGSGPQIREYMLVSLLASPRYMQTAQKNQTSPTSLMDGIKRYVEDCGYAIVRLDMISFKPYETASGIMPDPEDKLKQGIKPNSAAIIHIGWYRYNKDKDEYTRITGHYVTVIGFGTDRQGRPDNRVVIIHDPWNGRSDDYIRLEELKSGSLLVEKDGKNLTYNLKGAYSLKGEMCIYEKADVGLLDHIHIIELANPKSQPKTRE